MTTRTAPPTVFWIISFLLLLWSLADLTFLVLDTFMANPPSFDNNSVTNVANDELPLWYVGVLAFAIVTGTASSIFLIMRKKIAALLASISFVAVIIDVAFTQFAFSLVDNSLYNWNVLYIILFFDLALLFFTHYSKWKNWIA
ncbi:hypothetical protein AAU57_03195 [Nonlabens sp. YIK11]|uniref:hypothetical protein n=1 Tax=Nonlabens sp. YIK11 TaxID=1453349 RepID=UPI0006DCFD7D|nr:hypothetical protein [Nonlabens sp. YIK11]KQC32446.1 hypothetical protein AAU57_03195 [Nonlabens sp. YIK11]